MIGCFFSVQFSSILSNRLLMGSFLLPDHLSLFMLTTTTTDRHAMENGTSKLSHQVRMDHVNSTTRAPQQDHSRQQSYSRHQPQSDLKTVGEYALHHLFNAVINPGWDPLAFDGTNLMISSSVKRIRRSNSVSDILITPNRMWRIYAPRVWIRTLIYSSLLWVI